MVLKVSGVNFATAAVVVHIASNKKVPLFFYKFILWNNRAEHIANVVKTNSSKLKIALRN